MNCVDLGILKFYSIVQDKKKKKQTRDLISDKLIISTVH